MAIVHRRSACPTPRCCAGCRVRLSAWQPAAHSYCRKVLVVRAAVPRSEISPQLDATYAVNPPRSTATPLEPLKRVIHCGSDRWCCIYTAHEIRHRYCQTYFAWLRIGCSEFGSALLGVQT